MKKLIVLCLLVLGSCSVIFAQDSAAVEKVRQEAKAKKQTANLSARPKDHFILLLGYNIWTQSSDSIQNNGFHRSASVYFMFDFPFKTNPQWSIGIGGGVASDNQYFENTEIDISGRTHNRLTFENVGDTLHYKKYKLNVTYLEAPIELRFTANAENPNKSLKAAIGFKVGGMVGANTKGKDLLNSAGNVINGHIVKEKSKQFFNTTRLSVQARFGYSVFNIFASYQVNRFTKEGLGPDIRPLLVGLAITGL